MKVAITGGAGRQSLSAIWDFVETSDVEKILLIDINEDALQARKELVKSDKIETKVIDLKDTAALAEALMDYDVVINGSSHIFNMDVMNACIESKTNYTDCGGLFHWAVNNLRLEKKISLLNICIA